MISFRNRAVARLDANSTRGNVTARTNKTQPARDSQTPDTRCSNVRDSGLAGLSVDWLESITGSPRFDSVQQEDKPRLDSHAVLIRLPFENAIMPYFSGGSLAYRI